MDNQLEKEKERIISIAAAKRDEAITNANATIKEETERKSSAEAALASLGAFKFKEKKEKKWTIEYATQKISESQASISAAEKTYTIEIHQAEDKRNSMESDLQLSAEKEYPLPTKPSKPAVLIEYDKKQRTERREQRRSRMTSLTASQQNDELLRNCILDYLEDEHKPVTVSDMLELIPELYGESSQHVSALLRSLVVSGELEKFTDRRRTYFRIPE